MRPRRTGRMLPDPTANRLRWAAVALICVVAGGSGCDVLASSRDPIDPEHATYVDGLRETGLADAPAGRAWIRAAETALLEAGSGTLPLHAEGWIAADSAAAVAWRFPAPQERWLTVRAALAGARPGRLFVEVYRLPSDPADAPVPLASALAMDTVLSFRVRGRDDLVLRLQPELLRGGTWSVDVTAADDEPAHAGVR